MVMGNKPIKALFRRCVVLYALRKVIGASIREYNKKMADNEQKEPDKKPKGSMIGVGISIGVALGMLVGLALDNIGLGSGVVGRPRRGHRRVFLETDRD